MNFSISQQHLSLSLQVADKQSWTLLYTPNEHHSWAGKHDFDQISSTANRKSDKKNI